MKKILITGSAGFIGQKLCAVFTDSCHIIAFNRAVASNLEEYFGSIKGNLTDTVLLESTCKKYRPDIVIHCAGIAHQKIGRIDAEEYFRVNSLATENLARAAAAANSDVKFIFLSSISVYGEGKSQYPVSEDVTYNPSSDYAKSKVDAEKRLVRMYDSGELKKLDILRLAPVYDDGWALNLEKRVFATKKLVYMKFGSGEQEMSAVSRRNLVDFIEYRLGLEADGKIEENGCNIFNVCDEKPYKFEQIIRVFKQSEYYPGRLVLRAPLGLVWIATRLAGLILRNKRLWLHSCYDKLAYSLVFDNKKMLGTGFKPKHNLESVFLK